ncbi:YfhD family protein [Peribacillus acanthi]|uniref:YfhD family protein n=1 Tax=Peribacillus acanthi TaxID=2171554 RepID=UPI000D3EDABB|nr:YfhD family protein [Peribacillus acanthi]
MGRGNNHTSSSNNKNSLPQTPKNLKIEPNRVTEEFAEELAHHGAARESLNKKSK